MQRATLDPAREERGKEKSKKQDIAQQLVAEYWVEARYSPAAFRFMTIDRVPIKTHDGDFDRTLLQRETYWIYELDCVAPKGLNGQLVLSCFLK